MEIKEAQELRNKFLVSEDGSVLLKYSGNDECIILDNSITEIGDRAFEGNDHIRKIEMNGVTRVGTKAFGNCSNLESVIMNSILEISDSSFIQCRLLESITLCSIRKIGMGALAYCSNLDIGEIPETLEQIGEHAFAGTAIRNIDIHWMEEIPGYLFSSCESLECADISGARFIGENAFFACKALKNVVLGSVEEIAEGAFSACATLALSSLPGSLKTIGSYAFSGFTNGFVIPKSVESIGTYCLGGTYGSRGWSKKITIYKSLLYEFRKYLGIKSDRYGREYRFERSPIAMEITVLNDLGDSVTDFIPIFCDDYPETSDAILRAFNPDNTFNYSELDKDIWHNRIKDKDDKLRIAALRLKYPYDLDEKIKDIYVEYVSGYINEVGSTAIREGDIYMLKVLCENGLIKTSNIKKFIKFAIDINETECAAYLQSCQSDALENKGRVADDIVIEFEGKKFVTTGLSADDERWVREEVESKGGEYKPYFVVSLDYLIYDPLYDHETAKLTKARGQVRKGKPVQILTISEFKKKIKNKA